MSTAASISRSSAHRRHYHQQQRHRHEMIEIAPNLWVKYRGAEETWACVLADFYMPNSCVGCSSSICCIQDAQYFVCPTCQTISPTEAAAPEGGVALGFTIDDLYRWQAELIMAKSSTRNIAVH